MRAALLFALLAGCAGPDRWSLTGGSGRGDVDGPECVGDFDTESRWVEVGVSGPIGRPAPRRTHYRHPPPPATALDLPKEPKPPPVVAPPADGCKVPWPEIVLIAGAFVGALEGGKRGVSKLRARKAAKPA